MPVTVRLLRFAAFAALGLLCAGRLAAQASLPKESPFMPTGVPAVITASGEVYEFAAVSTIDKKTLVNIYDKQGKKGRWIPVGETLDGIAVKNYDAAREQVVVTIGGAEKVLTLRKSSGVANAPTTVPGVPQATYNVVPPAAAPTSPHIATMANPVFVAPLPVGPAATAPAPQPPPPVPGSIAHQEQEARMLVSDLLEIGMAQRKAYEEKQKAAAAAGQQGNALPGAPAPTNAPAPVSPPAGK